MSTLVKNALFLSESVVVPICPITSPVKSPWKPFVVWVAVIVVACTVSEVKSTILEIFLVLESINNAPAGNPTPPDVDCISP